MEHLIPLYTTFPFILMLGAIALMPLFWEHFWEKNSNKLLVSLALAIPTGAWLASSGFSLELYNTLVFDYVPFLILLGALFVITGGIHIDSSYESKPSVNTVFLGIGAVLASVMGTTGAAMLMIRPILNVNKGRQYKVHTVLFAIGIIANCGGLLTPLGDPPLFMMYLRGTPFSWFFNLAPEWLFANGLLLVIYYFVDRHFIAKENPSPKASSDKKRLVIRGKRNFVFMAGVVLSVAFINGHTMPFIDTNEYFKFIREGVTLLLAVISFAITKKEHHEANDFSWGPIQEVAYLFLGIFVTMVPCILYLEQNAATLGVNSPNLFYYFSGALSSFLDNTPTAVTFYSLAEGLVRQSPAQFAQLPQVAGIPEIFMKAICTGAVFFGSMSYIGNGPNFMVKAIADSAGVEMPHFFAYMYKFSLIVLLPIFILTQLIFIGF